VGGSGSSNDVPKWITYNVLGNSIISDNGSTVTISGNIAANNITATPTANKIPIADASGTLNAWVTHSVRQFYTVSNGAQVTCPQDYSWATLTYGSTSGYSGYAMINAAVSAQSFDASSSPCYVSLWIDSSQIGSIMRATSTSNTFLVSLSPVTMAAFNAGAHYIYLKLASTEGRACTVNAGYASLNVTEYIN
jgi:hypothetical protein